MLPLGEIEFGGGIVRQRFTIYKDGKSCDLLAGHRLTADEVKAMANHRTLISSGRIAVYPKAHGETIAVAATGERHIVHKGGGRFDVIMGTKLNDRDLSKDEAEDLATQPT